MDGITIPRSIKISSKYEDNSIELIRKRLRESNVNHLKFDPST